MLEKRQRGRGGTGGVAGDVEREPGEEPDCTEEANGEKEQEVKGQSGGVVVL